MNRLEQLQQDIDKAATVELRSELKAELNSLILRNRAVMDAEIQLSRDKLALIQDSST